MTIVLIESVVLKAILSLVILMKNCSFGYVTMSYFDMSFEYHLLLNSQKDSNTSRKNTNNYVRESKQQPP